MATRKGKLGAELWGNFYRLDSDKYTEETFREKLASVGVQTTLEAANGTTISKDLLFVRIHDASVEFQDEQYGTTWGHFLTSADDYGADRLRL